MNTHKELIEKLESKFAETSSRRIIGKLLVNSEKMLTTEEISDLTGFSHSAISSSIIALGDFFSVKRSHHPNNGRLCYRIDSIGAGESGRTNELLRKVFSPLAGERFLPNGYFKGRRIGSIPLC